MIFGENLSSTIIVYTSYLIILMFFSLTVEIVKNLDQHRDSIYQMQVEEKSLTFLRRMMWGHIVINSRSPTEIDTLK